MEIKKLEYIGKIFETLGRLSCFSAVGLGFMILRLDTLLNYSEKLLGGFIGIIFGFWVVSPLLKYISDSQKNHTKFILENKISCV